MAGSLFMLFDDVTSLMDDVASVSKIALQKSAGVTGDDIPASAVQVQGIAANRELPVIWKITKGSLINKLILMAVLMLIAVTAPILTVILLFFGACYLGYEGGEKVLEKLGFHHDGDEDGKVRTEEEKIKSALKTDMVLSAEIMIIALGATAGASIAMKLAVLAVVAIAVTAIIYGLVALLIRLDDMGYALVRTERPALAKIGYVMVNAAPKIMRVLSVVGTVAMFLVAGGIFAHVIEIEAWHHFVEAVSGVIGSLLTETLIGFVAGVTIVFGKIGFSKLINSESR